MKGLTLEEIRVVCAESGIILGIKGLRYHKDKGHLIPCGRCGHVLLFDEHEVARFIADMRRKSRRGLGARHG